VRGWTSSKVGYSSSKAKGCLTRGSEVEQEKAKDEYHRGICIQGKKKGKKRASAPRPTFCVVTEEDGDSNRNLCWLQLSINGKEILLMSIREAFKYQAEGADMLDQSKTPHIPPGTILDILFR